LAKRASTRGTVLIAGAANIFVGAIKLAAGLMVGSSAMLAEAAHSAADTLNQAFLLTSVHRGERAPPWPGWWSSSGARPAAAK
jgi:divalent metal cation (Fe/Co/Zn/Cd) transporter